MVRRMTISTFGRLPQGLQYALLRVSVLWMMLNLLPTIAAAQPLAGQFAAGGDVGLFFPADDQFDSAAIWGGFLEGYATRRVGIRGSVFVTSPEYERGTDEHERQIRLGADVIYNWEGGRVHPFVGAGLGAHLMQFTDNGEEIGDSDTRLGFGALGGLEYFVNRAWTVKGEVRYQWVDDQRGVDPDGVALTIGLKRYF
jgi:opacity protein-like surface antigen